ncbi:helix-turn-helix transcriptional regulator [Lipingzhangella sp. LS1_29]|uniref:Helix-turn-helix transcriptional regulator n=1 Tax=Lipingzhangella rawalii TaxID=2055835 RepID=A0ABU2H3D9_9ACTN|nr:helix-turn-helix transcriptional regulator [Lipingzhangella rawalii]MDS1269364.1 helix-turn-helix transcriptional regulator [Lipingzhangella rawalii]
MQRQSPTVRQRRLARELRRIREDSGLRTAEVARSLDWSVAKLSRIETGQIRAHWGDVADLLDHYRVGPAQREALITLAREARQRSWWSAYSDVLSNAYVGLEAEASSVWLWCPQLVPELLQVDDYAHAVLKVTHPTAGVEEQRRRIEALGLRRQNLERTPALSVDAIVDESVLCRVVDSARTRQRQLEHLLSCGNRDNVRLRVLPFTVGAHAGIDGACTILSFDNERDPDVVYVSSGETEVFLENGDEVARHRRRMAAVAATALEESETRALIASYYESCTNPEPTERE